MGLSAVQEVLPTAYRIKKLKRGRMPYGRFVEPLTTTTTTTTIIIVISYVPIYTSSILLHDFNMTTILVKTISLWKFTLPHHFLPYRSRSPQ
jgi:hypothetical protein